MDEIMEGRLLWDYFGAREKIVSSFCVWNWGWTHWKWWILMQLDLLLLVIDWYGI